MPGYPRPPGGDSLHAKSVVEGYPPGDIGYLHPSQGKPPSGIGVAGMHAVGQMANEVKQINLGPAGQ